MREGVSIEAAPLGGPYNKAGGYKPGRPDKLLKFSSRTLRPVVDFSVCTKCTLCWLQCQDGSFDVTPDGYYDPNMQYCMGCGVCEAVCPVPNCITMVNELAFNDNANQWEAFHKDKAAYKAMGPDEDQGRARKRTLAIGIAASTKKKFPQPWKSLTKRSAREGD